MLATRRAAVAGLTNSSVAMPLLLQRWVKPLVFARLGLPQASSDNRRRVSEATTGQQEASAQYRAELGFEREHGGLSQASVWPLTRCSSASRNCLRSRPPP
jgi:hypothetical protein